MSAKRRKDRKPRKPRAVIKILREIERTPVKPPKVDYADLPNINYYDLFIMPGRDVQHCDAAVIYHRADTMGRKLHPGTIASGISRPHCPVCMRRLGKKAIQALEADPAMHTNAKRRHPEDPGVIVHTLRMFRMPQPAQEEEPEPEIPPLMGRETHTTEFHSAFVAVPEAAAEFIMDEPVADEPMPSVPVPNIFDPNEEAPAEPELPIGWEILDDPDFAGIRMRGFLQPKNGAGLSCGQARVALVSLQSPPFGPADGNRLRIFLGAIPMGLRRSVKFVESELRRKIQEMERHRGALTPFHEFDSFEYNGDIPGAPSRPRKKAQAKAAMDIRRVYDRWETQIPMAESQTWRVRFPQEQFSEAAIRAILKNVARLSRSTRTRNQVEENILRTCQALNIESRFNTIQFLEMRPEEVGNANTIGQPRGQVRLVSLAGSGGWQLHVPHHGHGSFKTVLTFPRASFQPYHVSRVQDRLHRLEFCTHQRNIDSAREQVIAEGLDFDQVEVQLVALQSARNINKQTNYF